MKYKLGTPAFSRYQQSIATLKETIGAKYWDKEKKMFADREEKDLSSQHTNALAILTGMISQSKQIEIVKQLTNQSLAPGIQIF